MLPAINPTEPQATSVKSAPNGAAAVKGFFTLLILGAIIWYFVGVERNSFAKDAVHEYDIVKRHGSRMDICVKPALYQPHFVRPKMRINTRFGRLKNGENALLLVALHTLHTRAVL